MEARGAAVGAGNVPLELLSTRDAGDASRSVSAPLKPSTTFASSRATWFPVTFTYGGLVSNLQTDPEVAAGYCLDTMDQPTGRQACVPGQEISSSVPSVAGIPACPGS